ncbi:phosphate ABC transporter permease PstA [bacterium]|nr:phosphate ABC transporter permease PstA [bacterium]
MKNFWKSGDPFVWWSGGALAASMLMIAGLLLLILVNGLSQFWPQNLSEFRLTNGEALLGEVWDRERIPDEGGGVSEKQSYRVRVKVGNRDLYSLDFRWVDEADIEVRSEPQEALALERLEWGNFYGYFHSLKVDDQIIHTELVGAWPRLMDLMQEMSQLRKKIHEIERTDIGDINYELEKLRLERRKLELGSETEESEAQIADIDRRMATLQAAYYEKESELSALYEETKRYNLTLSSVGGEQQDAKIFDIVRIYRPNDMSTWDKSKFYVSKAWEFVSGEPRESNTEGGILPAIFGTVMLVMIMSIAVVPLGVLAAIYLREYAKQGFWTRAIRIAVNNLAGVPSIVYGVFGLGFFIYAMGGTIDKLFFPEALPTPTYGTGGILWASLTLALLTVPVVIVATEEGLAAVPREIREGSLALAATKFETLWRVVIPSAMPGILTGLILAIARAAGEVAPLMITGVVKLAPSLPLDSHFPFVHLERKFMHLGFHIYDVGFQSPNVEAAIPMVYSTTLLLILIVVLLNIVAIFIRNRLRRKLAFSVF